MNSQAPGRTLKQRLYDGYKRITDGYAKPRPSGYNGQKTENRKILYLFSRRPSRIVNVDQTIDELVRSSKYQYDLLNLCDYLPVSPAISYDDYDGVLIHNGVSYTTDILYRLDSLRRQTLADYGGLKVMMKQDDHYRTGDIAAYLQSYGFDLVLTIFDSEQAKKYYGAGAGGKLRHMQFLTGYVPASYHDLPYRADSGRTVDVGYRGSLQPLNFGRLAYEKESIGTNFLPHAQRRGLVTDISSRWEDRFMGADWLDFLGRCKAVLGVESGSDIVDAEGEAERRYKECLRQNPKAPPEAVLARLADLERPGSYRAISPRHFEAAACRTQQILFEGEYQNIFLPNRHYLSLKRDYGNVDEVIDRMLDEKERAAMCERAFEEIILNPEYAFETFVRRFDAQLDALFAQRG